MQRRSRLKIVTPVSAPARKPYVLNEQVGFLLRVAMQRHTSIFMSRMSLSVNSFPPAGELNSSTDQIPRYGTGAASRACHRA